jgi:hypothetical protein
MPAATSAKASAAASVSMWPASASSASEFAVRPATISPTMIPATRTSAIVIARRSVASLWS